MAPVTVVVDPNGSASGNTLCMDSRIARADTFLARDVPDWIKRTLDVDPDPRQWAAGGFSFGGTCAMQMVDEASRRLQRRAGLLQRGGAGPREGARQDH